MAAPTIRAAEPGDVPALSALAKQTWSDAFGDGVRPEDEAAELAAGRSEAYFAAALRETTILVAEGGGRLLGYVQFGEVAIHEADARPGDRELHRLYESVGFRRAGTTTFEVGATAIEDLVLVLERR